MAITFQAEKESKIKCFFRSQKNFNKRFRQGEFIEQAILEKIYNLTKRKADELCKNY